MVCRVRQTKGNNHELAKFPGSTCVDCKKSRDFDQWYETHTAAKLAVELRAAGYTVTEHVGGTGGHGSAPHLTVDPIVTAARTILALQTIASREVMPGDFAVVTVGYINAGTKNNIIPDRAELGLTVRTYEPEVRKQVLEAITRITNAEAQAAGAPRTPTIDRYETTDAVYNDPALIQGQVGTAVERLSPNAYEIEFSDDQGRTYASVGISSDKLIRPAKAA
jgi:metal-dependent amidase/aminoacylase/carboxypeptidase family protein